MPTEIYFNVAISGLLTGLIYGLSALGLSVIFGVIRIVNFAHGEIMVLGMFMTLVIFRRLTRAVLVEAFKHTLLATGMIFLIIALDLTTIDRWRSLVNNNYVLKLALISAFQSPD